MRLFLIFVLLVSGCVKSSKNIIWDPLVGEIPNCVKSKINDNPQEYTRLANDIMFGENGCEEQPLKAISFLSLIIGKYNIPEALYLEARWIYDPTVKNKIKDKSLKGFWANKTSLTGAQRNIKEAAIMRHPQSVRMLWELLIRSENFEDKTVALYAWALMLQKTNQPLSRTDFLKIRNMLTDFEINMVKEWIEEEPSSMPYTKLPSIVVNFKWIEGPPSLSIQ